MPEQRTIRRAQKDKKEGKAPSTQAGEFVHEEIEHVREGKHGARSAKQAIAIGLSKARRAGVALPPPKPGRVSKQTQSRAVRDSARGQSSGAARKPSPRRSRAATHALEREGSASASPEALAKQGRSAAKNRSESERSASGRKAVATKGPARRKAAAKKAARTRRKRSDGAAS